MPVTITDVFTADANPDSAPHRISAIPTSFKNRAQVNVEWSGHVDPIRATRITVGGNRKTGKVAHMSGLVCGLDQRCGPNTRTKALVGWTEAAYLLTYPEVSDGGADGARTVTVNVMDDTGAWL